MFRLFLIKKIGSEAQIPKPKLPSKQLRNRRLYERFEVDHKHLSLLNDQDILQIRNLSANGFACEVAERATNRLKVGDLYACRMRYANEVYELEARVAWKQASFVGFTVPEASPRVQEFFERVNRPIRIGSNMKPLEASLRKLNLIDEPLQFHGEDESRLVIWENENRNIESWYLEVQNRYIQWKPDSPVETGTLINPEQASLARPWESKKKSDSTPDKTLIQFALDLFMVLNYPRAEILVNCLV